MDELRDGRKDLPIFIHSELDEYGLDPYEFRIYSRLARRAWQGHSIESIPRMAEATQMSERKARYAVNLLFKAVLIEREHRSGDSSIIRLTPKERWVPKGRLEELRREVVRNHSARPEGLTEATAKKSYPPTPASGAGVDPGIRCRSTPASGAGVMRSFSRGVSPGEKTTNTNNSGADVFDEKLIAKLQAEPAYKHLNVEYVRDKMVSNCTRTGKEITVERLFSWLNREFVPAPKFKGEVTRPGVTNDKRKPESASERNARQRVRSVELLNRRR